MFSRDTDQGDMEREAEMNHTTRENQYGESGKSVFTISDQALRQTPVVKLLNAIFFAVFVVLAIKMLL